MQSHIRRAPVSLAVTCHLHFWQNDRDLVRVTVVTRGGGGGGGGGGGTDTKIIVSKQSLS